MFLLHVCLCAVYMPGALGGQKKVLGSLELELQSHAGHHVVLGIECGSSERVASALNC